MVIWIRREYLQTLLFAAAVISGMGLVLWHGGNGKSAPVLNETAMQEPSTVYVIDAGHGGEDGGAVSNDGTVESGINLKIAQHLSQILQFCGASVKMTRAGEGAIYSDGAQTLREKKVSDLKNRVALVNGISGSVLVSIHQNSLPESPRVRGAQAFYNRNPGADALAASVQEALNAAVNSGREKECKRISDSIYLTKHVAAPAVLVECGFLSNPEETAQLRQAEYQKRLAVAIASGLLEKR